jgi:isocitrate/isopropylmalate dehydrogenase
MRMALLPGDGVGPEVLAGPAELAREISHLHPGLEITGPWPVGATAVPSHGEVLPPETVAACADADCVLFGAVGDDPSVPGVARPELSLIELRRRFGLGISVRQLWRPDHDPLVIVRNLLGGCYVDDVLRTESDGTSPAVDPVTLEPERVEEVVRAALQVRAATGVRDVYSVDKANLFATSRLWRAVVGDMLSAAGVPVRNVLVDRFAFELAQDRVTSGLVITEGLFGDILSDLAAARAGSIALCSSASLNPRPSGRLVGLFEPVHGSAPRLAGKGLANPTGAYLALAAAFEWFPGTAFLSPAIRAALGEVMASGTCTYDMAASPGAAVSTESFASAVNEAALTRLGEGGSPAGPVSTASPVGLSTLVADRRHP